MRNLKEYAKYKKREHAKRKLTCHLGRIEEYEDRILCFIEKKPKKAKLECYSGYAYPSLAKKYMLDKPITYIFNYIDFNNEECIIEGDNDANLTFNNCNFSKGLNINMCNSLNITHGHIGKELRVVGDTALLSDVHDKSGNYQTLDIDIDASDVTIEKSTFEGKIEQFNFYINARNNLILRRANLGRQNNNDIVEIYTDTLTSYDSTFATPVENNDPQSLTNKSHTMISASRIIQFYGNPDEIGNILIDAPEILVNGTSYKYNTSISQSIYPEVNLQRIINPVSVKKLQLIELLKKLKTKCEERYTEKRQLYDEELKKEPLKRLLEK